MLLKYPEIDYRSHPAFIDLFEKYTFDDNKIDLMISLIDNELEKVRKIANVYNAKHVFEQYVNIHIDSLVQYVKMNIDSIVAFELFINGIEYTKEILIKSIMRDSLKSQYKTKQCNQSQLELLQKNGMCITAVNATVKHELHENSREHYYRLKAKAEQYPHLRSFENVNRFSPLSRSIEKLVKSAGILDIVSNYMQMDMKISGTGIEYSGPMHTWYKNAYNEIEGYASEHNYLHLDEAAHYPKTLYYLTPVQKAENGATKFIQGSHSAKRSAFVTTFHKSLDRYAADRYFKIDNTYYRPMFKTPELRKILAKLPARLIGSSHLGDDIPKGSSLSNELKENEVTFINDGSEAIVFDGGNGLHKGANVTEGERLSLQIVYMPKNEYYVNRVFQNYKSSEKMKILFRQMRELFL